MATLVFRHYPRGFGATALPDRSATRARILGGAECRYFRDAVGSAHPMRRCARKHGSGRAIFYVLSQDVSWWRAEIALTVPGAQLLRAIAAQRVRGTGRHRAGS